MTLVSLRTKTRRHRLLAGLLLGFTLTGHLSFAPLVAIVGLLLAWRTLWDDDHVVTALALLLGAFLLGLTPYLYIVWADAQNYPYNYLRIVDQVLTGGRTPAAPGFVSHWDRLRWLVLGRNQTTPGQMVLGPKQFVSSMVDSGALLLLFELGPLAALLVVWGVLRLRQEGPARCALLAGLASASILFASVFGLGSLLPIFLVPAVMVLALFAAFGLAGASESIASRLYLRGFPAAVLPIVLAVAVMLPAHALRLYADEHPIGPRRWHVAEEGTDRIDTLIPRRNHFREPAEFGARAMQWIPKDALVISCWAEQAVLYYFCFVLGQRHDLTLQPCPPPGVQIRIHDWAASHDLRSHPVVFVSDAPVLKTQFARRDSVRLLGDHWLIVVRDSTGLPAP